MFFSWLGNSRNSTHFNFYIFLLRCARARCLCLCVRVCVAFITTITKETSSQIVPMYSKNLAESRSQRWRGKNVCVCVCVRWRKMFVKPYTDVNVRVCVLNYIDTHTHARTLWQLNGHKLTCVVQ